MSSDLLDQRQRMAAALLLSAVDLPAEMGAYSTQLLEAAGVCPGLTLDQLSPDGLRPNTRRVFLTRARQLIDEILIDEMLEGC